MSHLKAQIAAARARGDKAAVARMEAIERREMATKHPGFKTVQGQIARRRNPRTGEPYGEERAGAILAAASRHASGRAKAHNPALRKVKG